MFMVLSSWQSHCQSSLGSFDECRTPSGRRPKTKPDDLGTVPQRVEGWVDIVGWLHTEMVYPSADGHPSRYNRVWRSATTGYVDRDHRDRDQRVTKPNCQPSEVYQVNPYIGRRHNAFVFASTYKQEVQLNFHIIHGTALNWFRSYLSSRCFRVKCNNDLSSLHTCLFGSLVRCPAMGADDPLPPVWHDNQQRLEDAEFRRYIHLWYPQQELSYRKQIARKLRTQYVEGIHMPKHYTVTLKSRLS